MEGGGAVVVEVYGYYFFRTIEFTFYQMGKYIFKFLFFG